MCKSVSPYASLECKFQKTGLPTDIAQYSTMVKSDRAVGNGNRGHVCPAFG